MARWREIRMGLMGHMGLMGGAETVRHAGTAARHDDRRGRRRFLESALPLRSRLGRSGASPYQSPLTFHLSPFTNHLSTALPAPNLPALRDNIPENRKRNLRDVAGSIRQSQTMEKNHRFRFLLR